MSLPLPFAKKLLRLLSQESIPIGQFYDSQINKQLLHSFLEERILFSKPQRNKNYIYCPNTENLKNYLREHYGIKELESFISYLENDEATKSDGAIYASNTKAKKIRVMQGFFIKTYEDIYGNLKNETISLKPPEGTWIYLVDFQHFKIADNVTIIGVENPETFRYIDRYRHLFNDIIPLFLLRYDNNSYIEWLQSIENKYLHFGDFDLSALAIYIIEFVKKLSIDRCKYFVPDNIEELIVNSKNRELYIKQLDDPKVKNLNFDDYKEITKLANLIMKYKTTVEQERLMQ